VIPAVLDVVPHAERDFQEFVAQHLGVVNRVGFAAQLKPPVVLTPPVTFDQMIAVGQIGIGRIGVGPRRRNELLGPVRLPRLDKTAQAHRLAVRYGRLDVLVKLRRSLSPDTTISAG